MGDRSWCPHRRALALATLVVAGVAVASCEADAVAAVSELAVTVAGRPLRIQALSATLLRIEEVHQEEKKKD